MLLVKMGVKGKKAMEKRIKKGSSQLSAEKRGKNESADFLVHSFGY